MDQVDLETSVLNRFALKFRDHVKGTRCQFDSVLRIEITFNWIAFPRIFQICTYSRPSVGTHQRNFKKIPATQKKIWVVFDRNDIDFASVGQDSSLSFLTKCFKMG